MFITKQTVILLLILLVLLIGAMALANVLGERQVACTMEAKLCPDGSAVGRSGPKCEFAECPGGDYKESELYFIEQARREVVSKFGQPIEGFDAELFMRAFSRLEPSDFDGVETVEGIYIYQNGRLEFRQNDPLRMSTASKSIDNKGMLTLLNNISSRLGVRTDATRDIDILLQQIGADMESRAPRTNNNFVPPISGGGNSSGGINPAPPEPVFCTMDAKQCPDGSYVGRVAPSCAFAPCPGN
jgi:hypothetical protein